MPALLTNVTSDCRLMADKGKGELIQASAGESVTTDVAANADKFLITYFAFVLVTEKEKSELIEASAEESGTTDVTTTAQRVMTDKGKGELAEASAMDRPTKDIITVQPGKAKGSS